MRVTVFQQLFSARFIISSCVVYLNTDFVTFSNILYIRYILYLRQMVVYIAKSTPVDAKYNISFL